MSTEFQLREASLDDLPLLVAFQLAMAQETEGLELDPLTVERGIGSFLQQADAGSYCVITQGFRTVGCAMLQYEWSDWRARRVLWLHSVYVVPESRRQGAFRALFQILQARVAREPDLAGIRLYVDKQNTQAEAVYRHLGMSDEHYKIFEWLKT